MSFGDELAARWVTTDQAQPGIRQRAEELLAARSQRQPMPRWDATQRPGSSAEAYAIQETVTASLAHRAVGWKLGCTSEEMQRKLGSDGPICGRAFENAVLSSGTPVRGARADMFCVEAEFAFRMGADLPPRNKPVTRAQVLDALDTLHPAIEQVESRFADWQGLPIHDIVADNSSHGRLVLGEPIAGWRELDLPACPIRLRVDGVVQVEGTGANVLGDPVTAMLWLARHLNARGLGLRRGEVVITGTCTGLSFVAPGALVAVEIARLGSVMTRFAA